MTKKKLITVLCLFASAIILILFIYSATKSDSEGRARITEKLDSYLGPDAVRTSAAIGADESAIKDKISKGTADSSTVDLLKFLQAQFPDDQDSLEEHFRKVQEYLTKEFGEIKALELMALYRKYTKYEMELASNELWKREMPRTPEQALDLLNDIHKHRQQVFGNDLADDLFGEEMKLYEYQIYRNEIIKDSDMYGADKERRIGDLQKRIWNETGERISMSELDAYELKLKLYTKDLTGKSEEQKKQMRSRFRREIFTTEEADRLEYLEWCQENEARLAKEEKKL
jgi:lipase chaperone LimK